jgi:hypothetical protein
MVPEEKRKGVPPCEARDVESVHARRGEEVNRYLMADGGNSIDRGGGI